MPLLLLPAIFGFHNVLTVPEERHLAAKFDASHWVYASSVHR
jgi:hypothetical protein